MRGSNQPRPSSQSTIAMWSVKLRPNTSSLSLGRGLRAVASLSEKAEVEGGGDDILGRISRRRPSTRSEPSKGSEPPAMGFDGQSPSTPDALQARNPQTVPNLPRWASTGKARLRPTRYKLGTLKRFRTSRD